MPFVRRKGETGLFFVPDNVGEKKHPCKDCHSCQWCADERCRLCRKRSCEDEGVCESGKKHKNI